MFSLARVRNSTAEISGSPRSRRTALRAVRRKYMLPTPGISVGYWKARNNPAAARCSGSRPSRSTPSRVTRPVTS